MDDALSTKLMDIYLDGNDDWKASEPDKDLDNLDEVTIEIEPKDAKTLDEIESFTVAEHVIGTVFTTITRRKIEEL